MRNPNGYGSVRKMQGKRRRPYGAYITTGWELEEGKAKQKQKAIGYYKTRQEAMLALAEYNTSPYDINARDITFEAVFAFVKKEKIDHMKRGTKATYMRAFALCEPLHKMKMSDIRQQHMQEVMDLYPHKSAQFYLLIKKLLHMMFRFALANDIVQKDYSAFVEVKDCAPPKIRQPFSKEELEILKRNVADDEVKLVLFAILTGMRSAEIVGLNAGNINAHERYIEVNGTKTESAKRLAPIHPYLLPFVEDLDFADFKRAFKSVCRKYGFNHTPHETRHTFISLATEAELNPVLLKKIVGHKSADITEGVYTHAYIDSLLLEIDKIKF